MKTLRIFISSPGDVAEERDKAKEVIADLQRRYDGQATLIPVLWEDLAIPATASFQEGIDYVLAERHRIDIAVFILWARLGSPLGPIIKKPDGTPYLSGTEREFDLMLNAFEQSGGKVPLILAYTRRDEEGFNNNLDATKKGDDALEELIKQRKLVKHFILERFQNKDGQNLRAYHSYREPVGFAQRLHTHLRGAIEDLLEIDFVTVTWTKAPYRSLEVFDIQHAPIFCGRDEETCDILQRLRDQQRTGCAFACIVGASGSGKSSLARAGVAATLMQRSFEDGIDEWRATVLLPSLAQGDLPQSLARTLSETLPELRTGIGGLDEFTACIRDQNFKAASILLQTAFNRRHSAASSHPPRKGNRELKLLLILDQMEELWTDRSITQDHREHFLKIIEALARSGFVTVLATLRSDFYPQAQLAETFIRMKGERGHFDLTPPGPAALQQIIVQPAHRAGLRFECDEQTRITLDQHILKDAARDPSALPLLQYALAELYEHRIESKHQLTFAAYADMDGVEGALGKRATQTFNQLPSQAQATLDELLPRLVSVDSDGKQNAVRRRATLADLTDTLARQQLTEALIAARFITTDEQAGAAFATLAHEALIRKWDRIVRWVADNRQQLGVRSRIEHQCERWQKLGKRKDLLLPEGLELQEGLSLLRDAPHLVQGIEYAFVTEFINESLTFYEAKIQRSTRLRRIAFGMMSLLTLAAIAGGVYANAQRQEALRQQAEAQLRQSEAVYQQGRAEAEQQKALQQSKIATENATTARQQAAIAKNQTELAEQRASLALGRQLCLESQLLRTNSPSLIDRSLLLAVEGASRAEGPEADRALRGALDLLPKIVFEKQTGRSSVELAMSPDGSFLAAASGESEVTVWKIDGGQVVKTLSTAVRACTFSPNGRWLATAAADKVVLQRLFGPEIKELSLPTGDFRKFAFSADSRLLAIASDGTISVWDTESGKQLTKLAVKTKIDCLLFSPDCRLLAAGSYDAKIHVWDIDSGRAILTGEHEKASASMPLRGGSRDGGVFGLAFHPSGKFVASAAQGGTVAIWKLDGGTNIFAGHHSDSAYSVAFSPDGRWMASGGMDHKVRVWNLSNLSETYTLKHNNWVETVRFTADGRLISVSGDGTARIWDMVTGQELVRMFDSAEVDRFAISTNATRAATGSWGGNIRVWDISSAGGAQKLYHESARGAVVSDDGALVVTSGDNTVMKVYSLPDGKLLSELGLDTFSSSVLFTNDSKRIITASWDGQVRIWDPKTGKIVNQFGHAKGSRVSAAFVPNNGSLLVTAGFEDGTARLWRLDTGEEIMRFTHDGVLEDMKKSFPNGGVRCTAFLPKGNILITGGQDGTVRFWSLDNAKEKFRFEIGEFLQALIVTPDGKYVVVDARDEISVWSMSDHQKVSSIRKTEEGDRFASLLSIDSEGGLAFEGGNGDRPSVRVRSIPDLKIVAELLHENSIFSAVLTKDGTRLVTGSQDKNVRIWDTKTWQLAAQFETQGTVYEVGFVKNEQAVMAASDDGFVRIWPVSTEAMIDNACKKLHRDLAAEEWRQYFGKIPYEATRSKAK